MPDNCWKIETLNFSYFEYSHNAWLGHTKFECTCLLIVVIKMLQSYFSFWNVAWHVTLTVMELSIAASNHHLPASHCWAQVFAKEIFRPLSAMLNQCGLGTHVYE